MIKKCVLVCLSIVCICFLYLSSYVLKEKQRYSWKYWKICYNNTISMNWNIKNIVSFSSYNECKKYTKR